MPERKIKPLSLSPGSKMGLVTKGRSFGPAAPKSGDKVSLDPDSSTKESDTARVPNSEAIINIKTVFPVEASASKSSPRASAAANGNALDFPPAKSIAEEIKEVNGGVLEAFAAKSRSLEKITVNGGADDRLVQSDGNFDSSEGEEDDYDEQRDINALIDR